MRAEGCLGRERAKPFVIKFQLLFHVLGTISLDLVQDIVDVCSGKRGSYSKFAPQVCTSDAPLDVSEVVIFLALETVIGRGGLYPVIYGSRATRKKRETIRTLEGRRRGRPLRPAKTIVYLNSLMALNR